MMNKILIFIQSIFTLLFVNAQTTTVQVGDLIENTMIYGLTAPLYRIGNLRTAHHLYSRHFFVYPLEDFTL